MPKSKYIYRLYPRYIEAIHDDGISFAWPGVEPVAHLSCRDINLLYSASEAPFQECFGVEPYPTLAAKAAYLFYHVVTSHIFENGNKRTGVLCLDQFLLVNSVFLTLPNHQVEEIAIETATHRELGQSVQATLSNLTELIGRNMVPISSFRTTDIKAYRRLHRAKNLIRTAPENAPGTPTRHEMRFGRR